MGRIVVVAYQPKMGKTIELKCLVQKHVPILRTEGLATEREAVLMQSANGSIIEVFEWVSERAIELAHDNEVVQAMWEEFAQICDFVPVASLPESGQLFSEFEALNT